MAAENDGNDYQVLRTIWLRKTGGYMKLGGFENSVQKSFTLGTLSFTSKTLSRDFLPFLDASVV